MTGQRKENERQKNRLLTGTDDERPEIAESRRTVLASIGAFGAGAALAGCTTAREGASEDESQFDRIPPEENTRWGETTAVGNGEVSTFVAADPQKGTIAGVEITPDALEGGGTEHVKHVVDFPETGEVPFSWLGLDWEPGGHYPGDTYAIPHFDFHFYFTPHEVVKDIPEIALPPEDYDEDELYTHPLPKDQMPGDYFRTNYVFGYMGEHLYDETAPQYNGGTFGNTYVYGHWEGELIFMEPMITLPYFEQLKSDDEPGLDQLEGVGKVDQRELSLPKRFPKGGEYPTKYTVRYHEDRDVFTVTNESFVRFEASNGPDSGVVKLDSNDAAAEEDAQSNADVTVAVAPEGKLVFDPDTVEIAPGDTVLFEWEGDYHNVVPKSQPADASWTGESEISETGHTYSHTFEVEGTYEYVCEPHRSQGMTGTIIVDGG